MGTLSNYAPVGVIAAFVIVAAVVAVAFAIPGVRAGDAGRAVKVASRTLLAGALLAVVVVTLTTSGGAGGVNLVPIRGITGELGNINASVGRLNLAGNVVMFMPLGLLAPLALRWGVGRVTAAAFALSAAIECLQLALGRSSDIDDVILNTTGALVGAVITCALVYLVRRRMRPTNR